TGQLAFQGNSTMATLAAVLNQEPKPLPANIPREMANAILHCLRKDPARRYQTMAEVRAALEALREKPRPPRNRLMWVALTGMALIAGVAGLFAFQPWRARESTEQLLAIPLTTLRGVTRYPSFSPDGNYVAFTWTGPKQDNPDIYVQQIGIGSPLPLTKDPR